MFILTYRNADGYLRVQPSPIPYSTRNVANDVAVFYSNQFRMTVTVTDYTGYVAALTLKDRTANGDNALEAYSEYRQVVSHLDDPLYWAERFED